MLGVCKGHQTPDSGRGVTLTGATKQTVSEDRDVAEAQPAYTVPEERSAQPEITENTCVGVKLISCLTIETLWKQNSDLILRHQCTCGGTRGLIFIYCPLA